MTNESLNCCPECGYTKEDALIHWDHHRCKGKIPGYDDDINVVESGISHEKQGDTSPRDCPDCGMPARGGLHWCTLPEGNRTLNDCPFCLDGGKPQKQPKNCPPDRGTVTCQRCGASAHVSIWNSGQRREISVVDELLKEVAVEMQHAAVFIATKEKMHSVGQEQFQDCLKRVIAYNNSDHLNDQPIVCKDLELSEEDIDKLMAPGEIVFIPECKPENGWYLDDSHCSDPAKESFQEFINLVKHGAKFIDIHVRKDAKEYKFQADILKYMKRVSTPAREEGDLIEAVKALAPFELVQGDAIHRTNPSSGQVVNSNLAWAVSNGERSAHKIRKHIETLNALTLIEGQKP